MTRVTGKFQITLPKRLVDAYGINVGDEVELVAAGETISIVPAHATTRVVAPEERLRLFDATTQRLLSRKAMPSDAYIQGRGWTREDLYDRDRSR